MGKIIDTISAHIEGDIHADTFSRKVYSIDASIYQIEPLAVVFPKTHRDIEAVVAIAQAEQQPIIPRGAGTGTHRRMLGKRYYFGLFKIFRSDS